MTSSVVGQFLVGLALSALMGWLGHWREALTLGGVLGAILVGTLIFGFGGWIWGLLLITFFISSSWLSHYRRADKEAVADKFAKGSRRDLGQVLANGALGAVVATVYAQFPDPVLFAAYVGVISTVNADTWATELGVLSRVPPTLITSGETVPPGTSGGVTRLGMWASAAGALLIGTVATTLVQADSLISGRGWSLRAVYYPLLAVVGGLAGSLFDSLLGATVQGIYFCDACGKETESAVHRCGRPARPVRGWIWLNNDLVNFAASFVGGLVAASLAWVLWR
jgi:uncharacterized protein (TIGR00297 family)